MGSNLEHFLVEEACPEKYSSFLLLSLSVSLSHGFFCSCSGLLSAPPSVPSSPLQIPSSAQFL